MADTNHQPDSDRKCRNCIHWRNDYADTVVGYMGRCNLLRVVTKENEVCENFSPKREAETNG